MDYQSNNLVVPRGSILFNPFVTGTFAGKGYLPMGNCPEFTLSRDVTPLEHRSSQQGYRNRDKRLIIGDDLSGSVMTDDVKADNMRLWFMSASVTTITTASATGSTETLVDVVKGRMYQLGVSLVAPTGLRNVTVTSVATGATVHVNNTDYTFDVASGMLTVLSGGGIAEDADLIVIYNVAASTHKQILADNKEVEGEIKFLSNNPFGEQSEIWIPRATITPNGDLSMLTDPDSPTWQQIPLTITALKLGSLPLAYRNNFPAA
jgi:hypothetical protein